VVQGSTNREVEKSMLFHVSEEPGIERFEPRASECAVEPAVWAIDAERLRVVKPYSRR
jgi:hypothetical protein